MLHIDLTLIELAAGGLLALVLTGALLFFLSPGRAGRSVAVEAIAAAEPVIRVPSADPGPDLKEAVARLQERRRAAAKATDAVIERNRKHLASAGSSPMFVDPARPTRPMLYVEPAPQSQASGKRAFARA
jgi:hypothetical protein